MARASKEAKGVTSIKVKEKKANIKDQVALYSANASGWKEP